MGNNGVTSRFDGGLGAKGKMPAFEPGFMTMPQAEGPR